MLLLLLRALRPALTRGATGIGVAVLEIALLARDVYLRLTLIGVSTPSGLLSCVNETRTHWSLPLCGFGDNSKDRANVPRRWRELLEGAKADRNQGVVGSVPISPTASGCHER